MTEAKTTHAGSETFWQRTCRIFMGDRVRIKLRGGTYLEGVIQEPQAYAVRVEQLAGPERVIEYSQILSVEQVP